MILGCLLFGVDLILFNFFMPLVFSADIPDLILRTFVDILTVTLGCLVFSDTRDLDNRQEIFLLMGKYHKIYQKIIECLNG